MDMRSKLNNEKGVTLVEALVGMLMGSVVLFGAMQQYINSLHYSRDNQIRISAMLQAQAVVQNIGFELRTLGNGVPFDQENFQIGQITLSDPTVTEPIDVASSTADSITFRVNETGDVFLLTQAFYPEIDTTAYLTDVSSLAVGDPIYISNSVVAGEDGLYGVIEAVDTGDNSIEIAAGFVSSPGSSYDAGSILEEVPEVTYRHDTVANQITRNSGAADVVIANNASIEFEYLDSAGAAITLPLDNVKVVDELRAIRVSVTVTSSQQLSSTGEAHTAEASLVFGLRNLNYLF